MNRMMDWSGSGYGQFAGCCECGDEPSGSIKRGQFLGLVGKLLGS